MTDSNDLRLPSLQRLQSAEQMELLDVVDSLRACGLSEIVALPQLIVCGDQSSGKSSVLEAISGIPFPREDNLCTRFATEVILRRATKDEISVSIVPGKERTPNDRDRLSRFCHELKTKDDFSGLFEIARETMGLSSTGKSFSNDVLRVEFCGPSQPQLTLVDLPGLIHSETKSQTPEDVKLVHSLVSQYLENPRSIILAVVSAKNDIGNQIILHRARQVDPQGSRTLGIITKPDLLSRGSQSEEAFIALARNEEVKFSLGWHVVKNLDSAINKNEYDSRDRQETLFFQESSFNCLPTHTVGIAFLRSRLSKVLFNQIRTELPRLVEDIQSQISSAKVVRDKLGSSRAGIDDQRSFLISLSQSFQTICRDAVRGDYDHEFFQADSNPERRLCANIMNMHYNFAKNIRKNGAFWLVGDENIHSDRYRTREEAIKEACILLKKSRGRELPGLPNPLLVGELFRQYSQPWGELARLHIHSVWEATNRFLELLLRHLTDDDSCENIFRFWLYPIMEEKLNSACGKLDELLEVHKDYPMTTNSHFINNSKRPREDNSREKLEDAMSKALLQSGQNLGIDESNHFLSTISSKADLDMDMVAAEEAFDNMNAYYKVAMNLFTDNVPTLAIQTPIIREVPKILCPTTVFSMKADIVERIAGETEEKVMERDAILRRLKVLENGAQICKLYAKRPQPFFATALEESNISELPVLVRQTQEPDNKSAQSETGFTRSHFPKSVPDQGIIKNPFSHLVAPSQMETPRSDNPQASDHTQQSKSARSPKNSEKASGIEALEAANKNSFDGYFQRKSLETSSEKPLLLFGSMSVTSSEAANTKPLGEENQSTKSSVGGFGSTGPFGFGTTTTKHSGGENESTKSSGGGFGSTGPFGFGTTTTKPSGGENAMKQAHSLLGSISSTSEQVPSPFGSTSNVSKQASSAFGSSWFSTPTENASLGMATAKPPNGSSSPFRGFGLNVASDSKSGFSSGRSSPAPAKTANSIQFPPTSNTARTSLSKSTTAKPFEHFIEPEPNSRTKHLNRFQHISFMPEYQLFSSEELRLTDYELGLGLKVEGKQSVK